MKRSWIKRRNNKRAAKRHEEAFGPKAFWIREHPCDYCGQQPGNRRNPICAGHVGWGRRSAGDSRDLSPMCYNCEQDFHHGRGRRGMEREHPTAPDYNFRERARWWEEHYEAKGRPGVASNDMPD